MNPTETDVPANPQDAPTGARRIEYMALSRIPRALRNAKRHNGAGIRASISEFGLAEVPLVDERTGRLVAGHGRIEELAALKASGGVPPDGVTVDPGSGEWYTPVVRGWASRSDTHADAYAVASNKLTITGGWDDAALDTILRDIAAYDFDLATTAGWGAADLEALLAVHDQPVVAHTTVPATGATYAETAEQEAARMARIADYSPRTAPGTAEVILVFTLDDRAEVARLIAAAREALGSELRTAELVLRALRTLVAVLDGRDDPAPVPLAQVARAAGWVEV